MRSAQGYESDTASEEDHPYTKSPENTSDVREDDLNLSDTCSEEDPSPAQRYLPPENLLIQESNLRQQRIGQKTLHDRELNRVLGANPIKEL